MGKPLIQYTDLRLVIIIIIFVYRKICIHVCVTIKYKHGDHLESRRGLALCRFSLCWYTGSRDVHGWLSAVAALPSINIRVWKWSASLNNASGPPLDRRRQFHAHVHGLRSVDTETLADTWTDTMGRLWWRSHTARVGDSAYIYMRLVLALPTIGDFPAVVDCPLSPEHIAANFSLE